MTELFNRPKTSLDWLDAQHGLSKTERKAMASLLQDLDDDAWCKIHS